MAALKTVMQIHTTHEPGDILVFKPGQEDVDVLVAGIRHETTRLEAFPLYANMSKAQQRMALGPVNNEKENLRKCVVATNIAETSLTINGIVYVVVSGLESVIL